MTGFEAASRGARLLPPPQRAQRHDAHGAALFRQRPFREATGVLVNVPSYTETVRSENATLLCVMALTLIVRLAPLPPKMMLASGTTVVFDEVALSTRLPAGVSTSPTTRFTVPITSELH